MTNYMQMITLLQVGYTTINVEFASTGRAYTYKTRDKCAPGDTFVVESPIGLQCVTVVEVHPSPLIDPNAPFAYKWTVQKVDRTAYDEHVALENEAVKLLRQAERDKAKNAMLDQLRDSMPTDPAEKERLKVLFRTLAGVDLLTGKIK